MKAAVIPPIPELNNFESGDLHFLLAHLLSNTKYYNYYADLNSYLILDNAAYEEGSSIDIARLLQLAVEMDVNDVALPDVIYDPATTIIATNEALSYLTGPGADLMHSLAPRLMLIPQGTKMDNWKYMWEACFHALLTAYKRFASRFPNLFTQPPIVGIPVNFVRAANGSPALLDCIYDGAEEGDYDIHFFGWWGDLDDLNTTAQKYPLVRSIDSAKPFTFAIHGIELGGNTSRVRRPKNYFTLELTGAQRELAIKNTVLFKAAARGELYA